MKNFEKFEKEIMEVLRNSNMIAVVNGKPIKCAFVDGCSGCFFNDRCCQFELFKWLYSEYVEPPKLTKQERKFCELFKGKDVWIAKDKSGALYLYDKKPHKGKELYDEIWEAHHYGNTMDGIVFRLAEMKFEFIKWEDEEPWSVAELLKLEVEE